MLKTVILAENPLDASSWTKHDVENVCDFLVEHFHVWPQSARIYHGEVANDRDVTPSDLQGIDRLQQLPGPFYVVVYPADTTTVIIAVIAIAAAIAAAYFFKPDVPTPSIRNNDNPSPNNELSGRSNKERINGRIPDIYGTVRSTPDLIAVPYRKYIQHQEVEHAYMCVGRGEYDIDDIRDGTTPIKYISGASVAVYGPYTSPNSGAPQVTVGPAINTPVTRAQRLNTVNGQILNPPNKGSYYIGKGDIRFSFPNVIECSGTQDMTELFAAGDQLTIRGAQWGPTASTQPFLQIMIGPNGDSAQLIWNAPHGIPHSAVGQRIVLAGLDIPNYPNDTLYLSGVYIISRCDAGSRVIYLDHPADVNPQWRTFAAWNPGYQSNGSYLALVWDTTNCTPTVVAPTGPATHNLDGVYTLIGVEASELTISDPTTAWDWLDGASPTAYDWASLSTMGPQWIGPFILDDPGCDKILSNFVCQGGLYKDDGTTQYQVDVTVELEITPVDSDDVAIGPAETFQGIIEGSSRLKSTRAITIEANPTANPGRVAVRARRVSDTDTEFDGNIVDEVKWRDVYSITPVNVDHFGNVTTVQSITYATSGALSVKERKLNLLATRRIQLLERDANNVVVLTPGLSPSNWMCDILAAVCLDPFIGGRQLSELDLESFLATQEAIQAYFGNEQAGWFNYTFDSDNLSFEETVTAITGAAFCHAYRRGSMIHVALEKATEDSVLLFNHRNKVPGTEVRTVRFGTQDDADGLEYEYVDPEDDAVVTMYLPAGGSAVKPKKVQSVGVRSKLQAYFQAHRVWNKMKFQTVTTEFEATQESDLLLLRDRILVADSTRPETLDGEVLEQNVLELRLSQDIEIGTGPHTIFLQLPDGTVESMPVYPGSEPGYVVLSRAPRISLVLDSAMYSRTTFVIVKDSDPRERAFLVTEKDPKENFTSLVRAVNYDARYYDGDDDFIDGVVNEAGEPV